jgi:hypothetical protein
MFSPTVENVLLIQKKRGEREEQLRTKMLTLVKERIQNYANFGQTNCIYTIPNFLIGYSPYNMEKMSKYIYKKLKEEGFMVNKLSEQYIYISWNIKDLSENISKKKSSVKFKEELSMNDMSLNAFANNSKTNKKFF